MRLRLGFKCGRQRIEVHLLQIVGTSGRGREPQVGKLRTALIFGDDILVEGSHLLAVEPIG